MKYRVWNVKRFMKEDEVAITGNGKVLYYQEGTESEYIELDFLRVSVTCSTGLKDKNSKEIFESDYVKGEHRSHEEWSPIQKVTYLNGCYMFGNWNAQEYFNKHTKIEIVGNIYENPELLKS